MEQEVVTAVAMGPTDRLISAVIDIIIPTISDWRFWFVILCTWAATHFLKGFWDHTRPKALRRRITEGCSMLLGFLLTWWICTGPYCLQMAFAAGMLNPYLYKFLKGAIRKYKPEWVDWLSPKEYTIQEKDGKLYAVRDDESKTLRLDADQIRKWQEEVAKAQKVEESL